ncbi:MAG: glycoside hydrolase family 127 protein [Eubacteriales bacterium]|nr:glycoside hydrolase family 127 protein [Eubacteriales bacterium]
MKENYIASANIKDVTISSGLFGRVSRLVREKVIPYQWEILNDTAKDAVPDHSIENFSVAEGNDQGYPSHCIANFKIAAGDETGDFYGMVFQDSDLAKWLEAVSYQLMSGPDPELERQVDDTIDLIGRAQQEDGYLNTYFTIKEPGNRFTNLCECHEMYCAGHMMEAAAAYYEATGKDKLLKIMCRMADLIDENFGPEENKRHGYPGHEEIELGLVKLYKVTNDKRYLRLAKYFIDERGKNPLYFDIEFEKRNHASHFSYLYPPYGMYSNGPKYAQYHLPVREQKTFEGHAVRCMYLASGAVDVARLTGDEELLSVCRGLYKNMVQRRMYLTGGIGSTAKAEMFTSDYDLPNDLVYGETCASVGIMFFTKRLMEAEQKGDYADTMERALFNTCLAGMSLDGRSFFYVNPLEADPVLSRENPDKAHVLTVRPSWFGCACCPPNLSRMITSLPEYLYTVCDDQVYMNLYMSNQAKLQLKSHAIELEVDTEYPYEGVVKITAKTTGSYGICLRIPSWSRERWKAEINGKRVSEQPSDGFLCIDHNWNEGDVIVLELDFEPKRVYANPRVSKDVGKVAVQCGPLVYCLEEADNGKGLQRIYLPKSSQLQLMSRKDKLEGINEIHAKGLRLRDMEDTSVLYESNVEWNYDEVDLVFIPYYAWANRGENEMTVWIHEN